MNLEGFELEDSEINTLQRSYENLKKKFEVRVIDCDKIDDLFNFIYYLKSFDILNHYKFFEIINIFNLNPENENIKIINIVLSYYSLKQEVSEVQNIGYLELPIDLGYTLITPETKADKIVDLFLRREIDYQENKDFSDKFFVLASNKELVKKKLSPGIQNQLAKYPNINVEIKGNKLVAKFYKRMTIKETTCIALTLQKIFKEITNS